jgi:ribonuclease E
VEGEQPHAEGGQSAQPLQSKRSGQRFLRRRHYKIQEVVKRRQVMLVQVVKEERGNKGAALTTYLSLAGRYCVLMPNTTHGGGISRKISNGADRKRLKSIMTDLKLPSTMGLIVRTAGLSRTKVEIKRDFDYLARLWDEIRERTLKSTAPALIYRDSDLIKRAIRDLYHRDIDDVIVEGEEGYKAARGFMKLLMPSHVKRVTQHSETTPLFQRSGVEDQLNAMYQPTVQLKSGGYLVINPTEALVSIDINSGRSTREHNIEQTAYNTNVEATAEIARQLRLRDMAGLVVIDFIDMEQGSHNRKVEKAMKDAVKNDRARIQIGRISSFGLMEMSRQRLRTGVLEASTRACPHCEGTGLMRTAASAGLAALRIIEDVAARGRGDRIVLRAGREAAVYVLNKKRAELADIELRYGVSIEIAIDETFEGARMTVDSSGARPVPGERAAPPPALVDDDEDIEDDEIDAALVGAEDAEEIEEREDRERASEQGDRPGRRRRRRRGGRGRGRRDEEGAVVREAEPAAEAAVPAPEQPEQAEDAGAQARPRRRRRGRKGSAGSEGATVPADSSPMIERPVAEEPPIAEIEAEAEEKPKSRRRKKAEPKPAPAEAKVAPAETAEDEAPKPKRPRKGSKAAKAEATADPVPVPAANTDIATPDDDSERRSGWWQRTFG